MHSLTEYLLEAKLYSGLYIPNNFFTSERITNISSRPLTKYDFFAGTHWKADVPQEQSKN